MAKKLAERREALALLVLRNQQTGPPPRTTADKPRFLRFMRHVKHRCTAPMRRVVRLLADLADVESSAKSSASRPSGCLHVECAPLVGPLVLVPAMPEFSRSFPDIEVNLRIGPQAADLIAEGIDCAIRLGKISSLRWQGIDWPARRACASAVQALILTVEVVWVNCRIDLQVTRQSAREKVGCLIRLLQVSRRLTRRMVPASDVFLRPGRVGFQPGNARVQALEAGTPAPKNIPIQSSVPAHVSLTQGSASLNDAAISRSRTSRLPD